MSETQSEREFVRRLKATTKKGAAIAVTLVVVAFGLTVLLPLSYMGDATRRTPTNPERNASQIDEATPEPAPVLPDPDVRVSLIVPDGAPEGFGVVGIQTVVVRASQTGTDAFTFGTGFIVDAGIVVTAAHLFKHFGVPDAVVVRAYCDGKRASATLMARDDRLDIAVLSAPECDGIHVDVGARTKKRGKDDKLYATGYSFDPSLMSAGRFTHEAFPLDDSGSCAQADTGLGKLAAHATMEEPPMRYGAFTGALARGNSGSPVIDSTGKVVGMFIILNEQDDLSCYVPGEEIARILDLVR